MRDLVLEQLLPGFPLNVVSYPRLGFPEREIFKQDDVRFYVFKLYSPPLTISVIRGQYPAELDCAEEWYSIPCAAIWTNPSYVYIKIKFSRNL